MWANLGGAYYYGLNYYFSMHGGASYGVSINGPSFETYENMMTAAIKELVQAAPNRSVKKQLFPGFQLNLFHENYNSL